MSVKTKEELCSKFRTRSVVMEFYGIFSYKTYRRKIRGIRNELPIRGQLSPENIKRIIAHFEESTR